MRSRNFYEHCPASRSSKPPKKRRSGQRKGTHAMDARTHNAGVSCQSLPRHSWLPPATTISRAVAHTQRVAKATRTSEDGGKMEARNEESPERRTQSFQKRTPESTTNS